MKQSKLEKLRLFRCVVFMIAASVCLGQDNLCWTSVNNSLFSDCSCLTGVNISDVILKCDFGQNSTDGAMFKNTLSTVTGLHIRGKHACEILEDLLDNVINATDIDIQSDGSGRVINLTDATLTKLGQIKRIRFHNCNIRDIKNGYLDHITDLEVLDVSGNSYLTFYAVASWLASMPNTRMTILNISGIHNAEDMDRITIVTPMLQAASISDVKVFDFSWTRLDEIQENFYNLQKLEVVNLTGTILVGDVICLSTLLNLNSLQTFVMDQWPMLARGQDSIVSLETPKYLFRRFSLPCVPVMLENLDTGCFTALGNLKTIQLRVTDLNSFYLDFTRDFFCLENQSVVNMMLSGSTVSKQIASFRGFDKLKYFDLSYPVSAYDGPAIKADGFHEMPILEVLLIPGIKMARYTHDELIALMSKNPLLRILDISKNGLVYLPENTLNNNVQLEILNMSGNFLSEFNFNVSGMMNLQVIDMSSNRLKSIAANTMDGLKLISTNRSIILHLKGNRFVCNCNLINFTTIKTVLTSFSCDHNGVSYTLGNQSFDALPYEVREICDPPSLGLTTHLILAIALSSAAVFVATIVYAMCVVLRKRRHPNLNLITLPTAPQGKKRNPTFIAFLAYCYKDYDFTFGKLYPRMNKKLKTLLKQNTDDNLIIVNDRNFLPGKELDNLISKAIQDCYVTVAVISVGFLESSWCQFEVLKSFNENVPLIPLYVSKLNPDNLTGIVKELYNTRARILWPDKAKHSKDKRKQHELEEETIDLLCKSIMAHVEQCKEKRKEIKAIEFKDNAGFMDN